MHAWVACVPPFLPVKTLHSFWGNPSPASQITPHILIFWRPDISEFVAYMTKPAPAGAKVRKDIQLYIINNNIIIINDIIINNNFITSTYLVAD